jgi:ABC-type glutathione transport system ATPase component
VSPAPLLAVTGLRVAFEDDRGNRVETVSNVSLSLMPGRTLGIVGESGCGKSVTALSIMRLLPKQGAHLSGSIVFEGRDLDTLPEAELRDLRGNRPAMIFQEPMTSLNPSFTIGNQMQVSGECRDHRGFVTASKFIDHRDSAMGQTLPPLRGRWRVRTSPDDCDRDEVAIFIRDQEWCRLE